MMSRISQHSSVQSMVSDAETVATTRSLKFRAVLTVCAMVALAIVLTGAASAQSYSVLHNFTGGHDGAIPNAGVTVDAAGNLYGTTSEGGTGYRGAGFGAIYELKLRNGNYTVNSLYQFTGGADGADPYDRVVFGPDGVLYGTAYEGGNDNNGVVFKLQPRPTACGTALCSWMETVLYPFPADGSGGGLPYFGDVIFDGMGNMYGTTLKSSAGAGDGVVWELTPPGTWGTETVLNTFTGTNGHYPAGGPIFDSSGNLYGTTPKGGPSNDGVVYQLVGSSGGWTENVLYNFTGGNDGSSPVAGLVFDAAGNLYGAATSAGAGAGGAVFELSPPGTWTTFTLIYSFPGGSRSCTGSPGGGPWAQLTMDGAGNLYGTTCADGTNQYGNVFELSPSSGGWTYTDLYDFTGGTDGGFPVSNVVCDSAGNLYGTASFAGYYGSGVVWKISGVGCLPTGGQPFRQ